MVYLFGGIALDTDRAFDQLEPIGDRRPHQRLSLRFGGTPPDFDGATYANVGRYDLKWGRAGDRWVFRSRFPDAFTFDPANATLDCHLASEDPRAWQDVLFRRVLPRIAVRYGATAVHAAAIATHDRCLLLLGPSGAGKSTLTAFCAQAGWQVLSEDTSLLWLDDEGGVEPVQAGVGLWEDTREALGLAVSDCVAMPGYDGRKSCYRPARAGSPHPRPLSALLVLDRSPGAALPTLTPLPRDEALRTLAGQVTPFHPGERPDAATARAFGRIAALTRRLPSYRLRYPHGYPALPVVEALLRGAAFGDDPA